MVYQRQVYKQQQSNVAVDASKERRYFEGVQGDKQHQGELFGLSNMFTLANEEITRMQSLVDRERRSAAEYAFEIKSAAEIEAAARAKAEADKKDADGVAREGQGQGLPPRSSRRGAPRRVGVGVARAAVPAAVAAAAGVTRRGIRSRRRRGGGCGSSRRRRRRGARRRTAGDARMDRRMFTRGEDRVVHEHRHDNIVGDDGPGGLARRRGATEPSPSRGGKGSTQRLSNARGTKPPSRRLRLPRRGPRRGPRRRRDARPPPTRSSPRWRNGKGRRRRIWRGV